MDETISAQTFGGGREIVTSLDREFARLHLNCCELVERTPADALYACPRKGLRSMQHISVGDSILRATAAIEQTFGGITSNLWDDPFEWTLPEHLSDAVKIVEHLKEVEVLRRRAFSSFVDDSCLLKQVAVPSGETRPLIGLLLETLVTAVSCRAQAATCLDHCSRD